MDNPQSPEEKKRIIDTRTARAFAKYSALGIQMGIIILLGVLLGQKLDAWLQTDRVFALICSLLSVFAAMYYSLKDFITPQKKDKQK